MNVNKESFYIDKDIIDTAQKIEDDRGFIQGICDLEMKSASIIFTKKNQWRANHYHKKDWHVIYVTKARVEYYFRKTTSNEDLKKTVINVVEVLFNGIIV